MKCAPTIPKNVDVSTTANMQTVSAQYSQGAVKCVIMMDKVKGSKNRTGSKAETHPNVHELTAGCKAVAETWYDWSFVEKLRAGYVAIADSWYDWQDEKPDVEKWFTDFCEIDHLPSDYMLVLENMVDHVFSGISLWELGLAQKLTPMHGRMIPKRGINFEDATRLRYDLSRCEKICEEGY